MILVAFLRQSALAYTSQQKYEINVFRPLQIKYCHPNDDLLMRITRSQYMAYGTDQRFVV